MPRRPPPIKQQRYKDILHVKLTEEMGAFLDAFRTALREQTGLSINRSEAARRLMSLGAQHQEVVPNARSDP